MNRSKKNQTITWGALLFSLLWIMATSLIGMLGLYEYPRQDSHAWIIISVLAPSLLFAVLFGLSAPIRGWTRQLDLAILTLPHAWRTVGYTFLTLWAIGILPAGFAAPAGFGDFFVAIATPFVVIALWRKWSGAIPATVTLHLLGFLDLFIALLTGITGFGVALEEMARIDPMTTFPLVIIPTAFVPLLVLSHVMALTKIALTRSKPD